MAFRNEERGRRYGSGSVWLVVAVLVATGGAYGAEPATVSPQARELHESSLVFDGHNNLLRALLRRKDVTADSIDLNRFQQGLHTDIPRWRQGGLGAEFFATYVSADSVKKGTAVRETLEQIEALKTLVQRYPDAWEAAYSADDIQQLHKQHKLAALIAIENGDAIDSSLAVLRSYHQAGVRCLALTHDYTHGWADAALDKARHEGLSSFGEQVVAEMNRLGMVIDLSHASEDTIRDALTISRAPVLFSHSGARHVAPHPRNLSDEILRLVARNGGVVQVNFFPAFLTAATVKAYQERTEAAYAFRKTFRTDEQFQLALPQWLKERPLPVTTVADVVNHIDHIVQVAGIDHVGLGSNYDGIVSVPQDLADVSCFPLITQELLNRDYTPEQVRKVLGQNTLRVLRQVDQVVSPAAEVAGRRPSAETKRGDQ